MSHIQTAAGYVFWVTLAALVPFWAIEGTEPTGHLALWFLYGGLVASALIWLTAHFLGRRSSTGTASPDDDDTYITTSHGQQGGTTAGRIERKGGEDS